MACTFAGMTTSVLDTTFNLKPEEADDFRLQAEDCLQLARLALTERNRLVWLRLAERWGELARTADQHSGNARMALTAI
jgi:hypothetical protein